MSDPTAPAAPALESDTSSEVAAQENAGTLRWMIGVVVAATLTWITLNYVPRPFELPEELRSGTVANNPELAAQAAEQGQANELKNGLIMLGLTGLYFGLIPSVLCLGLKQFSHVVMYALAGLVSGCAALMITRFVYGLITPDDIAMEREEPGMWREIIAYALLSGFATLPASLPFLSYAGGAMRSKAPAGLLGGIVAGLMLPILGSFIVPDEKTSVFPTTSSSLALVWCVLLGVLVLLLGQLAGDRPKATTT